MTQIFREEVEFYEAVRFYQLMRKSWSYFIPDDVTPSVKGIEYFRCSIPTVPCVITSFDNGQDLQEISILGEVNNSVDVTGNIITNTGAAHNLDPNKVYRFTYFQDKNKWIEDA